jgi:MSHA biogenesis protein MshP
MFPDYTRPAGKPFYARTLPAKQRGVSLAFLLFAIIIVSLLAAALVRLSSESELSNAQQVISTRAFFAAESGAQLQAMRIFPVAGGPAVCANQNYNFTANGVAGCTASTTCGATNVGGQNYYQVTSIGQCNAGQPLQATRTIQVRLKDLN